MTVTHPDTAL